MKALITTKYGPPEVLQIQEIEKPYPIKNEILVRVYATTVSSGDCRARSLNLHNVPFLQRIFARLVLGLTKPRSPVQGLWLSGKVEEVGKNVRLFKKGGQVCARTPDLKFGAYAEYACLPEKSIMALKPTNLSYEEAVSIPFGGLAALYFLRKGNIQKGQNVLIYGASGAVGTAAVQLSKIFGARIAAVCSETNIDLIKSLGADVAIDYTKEDFTKKVEHFDVIFDAVGKIRYSKCKDNLAQNGHYVSVVTSSHIKISSTDLAYLTQLVETKKLKPVIDRTYPFANIVEAHKYVDKGHKKGNVVITLRNNDKT